MVPASARAARWKENKIMVPAFISSQEEILSDPSPSELTIKSIRWSPSYMTKCFSSCWFSTGTWSRYVHKLFKSGILVSHNCSTLLDVNQMFCGASHPDEGLPCWGSHCGVQTPHSLRETSAIVISLLLVGCQLGVWVLTRQHLFPSYPSWCGL